MATHGDEHFQHEAQACLDGARPHFCSCGDTACPLNPNNPTNRARGRGCDGCIRKNLALGEIPSCFFNKVGPTPEGREDYSVAGFVRHCLAHGIGAQE